MGFGIIIYPLISKVISSFNQTVAVSKYVEDVENLDNEELKVLKDETNDLNEKLYSSRTFDASNENARSSIDLLKKFDIIAYINIPKINVKLPIYEGVNSKILEQGIGHIPQTSIPCGGINTHAVLSGHSGLSSAKLFDNIDKLEKDDVFYITYLNETLKYKVTDINRVLPDETGKIKIEEGKDLVTLVTCIPKYVNTHRLLVTGSRVKLDNDEEKKALNNEVKKEITSKKAVIDNMSSVFIIILFVIVSILVTVLIVFIFIKLSYSINSKK